MSDRDNRQVNISIDLAAIRNNLKRARDKAPGKQIFSVVKADAYGHGATRILPALEDSDAFAVANIAEGVALRAGGVQKPILVLQGFHSTKQLNDCVGAGLWPVLHHFEQLAMLAAKPLKNARIHCWVKVDTGMGRLGFKPDDIQRVYTELQSLSVNVGGLLTHFASADRAADISTDRQLKVFRKINWAGAERSAANSAALLSRSDSHFDWVRPGLMLYGADPMEYLPGDQSTDLGLQPAMRVTAPVIAIRELKRGDRVGYGGTYECTGPTRVAIVGAGYGDGYPRTVSAGTSVMLGNRRCPIIGRVSMDSMSVDISGLSVAPPIDYPVTLWGHASLRVDEIASRVGTIPYELLCGIRGKRSWHDPASEVNVRNITDN